ncbi:hypothetical protein [Malacoplasma penetrans]|nr:hypothetical protein [Malacoplasma penetrans]
MKNKIKKYVFCSSLFAAGISSVAIASFYNNVNNKSEKIEKDSDEFNASSNQNTRSTIASHTNYFSLPGTMPNNFTEYDLFARTNNSQFVQTNSGILGISKDKKTFFLTSYSGKIIWANQFNTNEIVKTFYTSKSWSDSDLNNLVIKEWVYLNSSNKTLAILLSDNTHQFITLLNLDNGMFLSKDISSNYELDVSNVFQDLSSTGYTNISRLGNNSILVWKNNSTTDAKLFSINNSTLTTQNTDFSSLSSTFNNRKILSFVASTNKIFAISVENTNYQNSNNQYKHKQYINLINNSSGNFTSGGEVQLNDYIINSASLDTTTFKNIFFWNGNGNNDSLIFIDGSEGNNSLNVLTNLNSFSNSNLKRISFAGDKLASVVIGNDRRKIFISKNETSENAYLGYVDISQTSLSFTQILQSTDTSTKNYFFVPVLSYTNTEYLILQNNQPNTIEYWINSSGNYQNTKTRMLSKNWKYQNVNGKSIWNAFGNSYLASSIALNNVSSYINASNIDRNRLTFNVVNKDDNNGRLHFWIRFTYASSFLSSFNETFAVYFYIKDLYALQTNFIFNWLDDVASSNVDNSNQSKVEAIKNLKKSKYATEITTKDILDNFISYTIKKTDNTDLTITESMITLSTSSSDNLDTLNVTITLPTHGMPNGFANSGKRTLNKTYTGFMSLKNYKISVKNNSYISTFTKTIYPSQLKETEIIDNFLTLGASIQKDLSNWTVTITKYDDILGTATLSVAYKGTSSIPSFDQLPENVKNKYSNIISSITYSGFKSINQSSSWNTTPNIPNYSGSYLPSEIWNQYSAYLNGQVSENEVILLQNLNFSLLTDKKNLVITCLNINSCDGDGYLDLEISIKENAETVVDYNGTQYKTSNGKLLFDPSFLTASQITYPYNLKWNITTSNKYFYLVDKNNNDSRINPTDNEYDFDIKKNSPFLSSSNFANNFSSSVSVADIESLIQTEGYNYEITLETNIDNGSVIATIKLSLIDKPLFEYDSNNSNFVRTINIYNFNVPMSKTAKILIYSSGGTLIAILLGVLTWYLLWKFKLINYKKKSIGWNTQQKHNKVINNLYKKNRFFKFNEEDLKKKK